MRLAEENYMKWLSIYKAGCAYTSYIQVIYKLCIYKLLCIFKVLRKSRAGQHCVSLTLCKCDVESK